GGRGRGKGSEAEERVRGPDAAREPGAEEEILALTGPARDQENRPPIAAALERDEAAGGRGARGRPGSQGRRGRSLNEIGRRKRCAESRREPQDQLRREKRAAAEVEKVVVRADPVELEHLRDDFRR